MFKKSGLTVIFIAVSIVALLSIRTQTLKNGAKATRPDSTASVPYVVSKKTFTTGNVRITYPQIAGMKYPERQNAINNLIKDEALRVQNYYSGLEDRFTLEVDYALNLVSEKLLSIRYAGVGYTEGAAYPNNLFYTTNINLGKGRRLRLKDLVLIDDSLIKTLRSGKLKVLQPEHREFLNNFTQAELLEKLREADAYGDLGAPEVSSYLTSDALGISLQVPHALGDHAEYEVKYTDMLNHLKFKGEI